MLYICITSDNAWGKGSTEKDAIKNAKREGGTLRRAVLLEVNDDGAYIDEMGNLCAEKGSEWKEIRRWGKK